MFQKLYLSFTILLFLSLPLYSNDLNSIDEALELTDISFRMDNFSPGKYIENTSSGFKAYDGGKLEQTDTESRQMYTFSVDFSLNSSIDGKDISLYLGPSDYPYNIYLNGQRILRWGTSSLSV